MLGLLPNKPKHPKPYEHEFEPKVIEKRQTRTDGVKQKIMAMYAKGMSQQDIEDTIREIYGVEASQTLRACSETFKATPHN